MGAYVTRHLVAAHAVVLKLQAAGVDVQQIQAKDIIAEALADAERGILVLAQSGGTPAPCNHRWVTTSAGSFCDRCGAED